MCADQSIADTLGDVKDALNKKINNSCLFPRFGEGSEIILVWTRSPVKMVFTEPNQTGGTLVRVAIILAAGDPCLKARGFRNMGYFKQRILSCPIGRPLSPRN